MWKRLADLVTSDRLAAPSQLLVRLHPIHMSGHYVAEADRIRQLAREHAHIHVVEPVPLGALGHFYSGEDVTERTSMMAHSDIFLTVYSTMCVEASFQERPIVSVCIDCPRRLPGKVLGAHVADRRVAHPFALPHFRRRARGAQRRRAARPPSTHYLLNPAADLRSPAPLLAAGMHLHRRQRREAHSGIFPLIDWRPVTRSVIGKTDH